MINKNDKLHICPVTDSAYHQLMLTNCVFARKIDYTATLPRDFFIVHYQTNGIRSAYIYKNIYEAKFLI